MPITVQYQPDLSKYGSAITEFFRRIEEDKRRQMEAQMALASRGNIQTISPQVVDVTPLTPGAGGRGAYIPGGSTAPQPIPRIVVPSGGYVNPYYQAPQQARNTSELILNLGGGQGEQLAVPQISNPLLQSVGKYASPYVYALTSLLGV